MLMMLTMLPPSPRSFMAATARCIVRNGARKLAAMCSSQISSVVSSSPPREVLAALLTSTLTRP